MTPFFNEISSVPMHAAFSLHVLILLDAQIMSDEKKNYEAPHSAISCTFLLFPIS
jgi:hypothetical protein